MGEKGKKNILPTILLGKKILDEITHPHPQELNGRPLKGGLNGEGGLKREGRLI